jgi:hypothetical protein
MHKRVHLISIALGAVLANGCGDDARLSVSVQPMPAPLNTAEVRYRIEAGVVSWTATLPAVSHGGGRASREFDTPTSGSARVSFVMVLPGGREVSSGAAIVTLRGDWLWGFDLMSSTEDPAKRCLGCYGSKSFVLPADLRTTGRDSLWLVWGGNSIKNPVVY